VISKKFFAFFERNGAVRHEQVKKKTKSHKFHRTRSMASQCGINSASVFVKLLLSFRKNYFTDCCNFKKLNFSCRDFFIALKTIAFSFNVGC
jgi:hypothetical protein